MNNATTTKVKVAIWMVTYNHEQFISQAIEGIISQETNFEYCLYIGEDCSTDNTRKICIEYQEKYPDKIRLLLNPVNNIQANVKAVYEACIGSGADYIAMCEGDDYWNDISKLQTQADFLDSHQDYSVCFHRVSEVLNGKFSLSHDLTSGGDGDFELKDLAKINLIPTLSVMFRNRHDLSLADWIIQLPIGDYPLNLVNGKYGKYRYMQKPMAVYRHHAGGMYSANSMERKYHAVIKTISMILPLFDQPIQTILLEQVVGYYRILIGNAYTEEDTEKAAKLIKEAVEVSPEMKTQLIFNIFPDVIDRLYSTRKYKIGSKVASVFRRLKLKK